MENYQVINNGTFDNDPSAEKTRTAFDKVNAMFAEINAKYPFLFSGQQGKFLKVKSSEDGIELAAVPGGGDMLSSNNLSDVADVNQSRLNLGLGTAAQSSVGAFATAAQGAKADSALQSVVAGQGITINVTDPQNPVITNVEINNYVNGISFNPANGILTLTYLGGGNITVDLSAYTRLKIDGYDVKKGSGNTNFGAIEVGDIIKGYPNATTYIHAEVTALPYTTATNRKHFQNIEREP